MGFLRYPDIRIAGISAAVPKEVESNYDYNWISKKARAELIKTTGVEFRHVSHKGKTTSDLCEPAAEKLIEELGWDKNEIQLLIFISQSRDYITPPTACLLQNKLGLPKTTIALDVVMGCSAYNYGLSVAAGMMQGGFVKKALLMMGDIASLGSYRDKSTYPLFGDAGTVTALEYSQDAADMYFNLQTDGSGFDAIWIPYGGFRNPPSKEAITYKRFEKGIIRAGLHIALDGMKVFEFALREVVPNIKHLLKFSGTELQMFDYLVLHQANLLINETIRKMLRVEQEKVPYSIRKYGNTSSASIPLTIVSELREKVTTGKYKMLLAGFGVGLSWGSTIIETDSIICPEVLEIDN